MPNAVITDAVEVTLAKDFAGVPEIRHVLMEKSGRLMFIWISVDSPVSSVRKRIYEKELEIIDCFPEVDFEFNIVPTLDRRADRSRPALAFFTHVRCNSCPQSRITSRRPMAMPRSRCPCGLIVRLA